MNATVVNPIITLSKKVEGHFFFHFAALGAIILIMREQIPIGMGLFAVYILIACGMGAKRHLDSGLSFKRELDNAEVAESIELANTCWHYHSPSETVLLYFTDEGVLTIGLDSESNLTTLQGSWNITGRHLSLTLDGSWPIFSRRKKTKFHSMKKLKCASVIVSLKDNDVLLLTFIDTDQITLTKHK